MTSTAVIMAAGLGTRFGNYADNIPKGFIHVSGKSMIQRSIDTLISCDIDRIIIGTGYKKEYYEALIEKYPQIECCYSSLYAETNSMFTLYNCRNTIGDDDFLLLESDLVFERKAITSLLSDNHDDIMLISPVVKFQDQYYIESDADGYLQNCSINKEKILPNGEMVGIHKLSNTFYKRMCAEYAIIVHEKPKLGYEYQLLYMSQHFSPVYVLHVEGLKWYEIDDIQDLRYAEENIIKYL